MLKETQIFKNKRNGTKYINGYKIRKEYNLSIIIICDNCLQRLLYRNWYRIYPTFQKLDECIVEYNCKKCFDRWLKENT